MSHPKTPRNDRIVRLREEGLSWGKIVKRIEVEFPEDAIKKTRVKNIYSREAKGIPDPGTLWRKKQAESK